MFLPAELDGLFGGGRQGSFAFMFVGLRRVRGVRLVRLVWEIMLIALL